MRKKIVFYDPFPRILQFYREVFEIKKNKDDYEFIYFIKLFAAERYIEDNQGDVELFVCGLHMKVRSGYDIAKLFLDKYPLIPIVILTTDVLSKMAYDVGCLPNVLYVDKKENVSVLRDVVDFLLINFEELRLDVCRD